MKRLPWFEILLAIVVMSMSLYAALSDAQNLSMRWFTRDDAYYYFKVAQNISEGHGSTFDGINATNGYHPLWLWVCIPVFALARFDLILPLRILLLVMSGLSAATAILLYRLIGKVFTPAIGAIAAIYWAFSMDILGRVYQQGLETGIAAFFIILFVHQLYRFERSWQGNSVTIKQLKNLGITAVFMTFSRLDLVFLAGMAGIWIVFRGHPLRYFLPFDIIAIITSVLLGFIYRISFNEYLRFADVAMTMIAIGLVIKIPCAFLFNLYQPPASYTHRQILKSLFLFGISTSAATGLVMILMSPLAQFEGFPRSIILYDFILTFLFFGLIRYAVIGLRSTRSSAGTKQSPAMQLSQNWKVWFTDGSVYYGVLGGPLAFYMISNRVIFGTFMPVSGQIKHWWGELSGRVYGGSAPNILSFFGFDRQSDGNAWHPLSSKLGSLADQSSEFELTFLLLLFAVTSAFYFILCINRQKARNSIVQLGIIPLICGDWVQVISYHIMGYSAYKEWYWIGQIITEILIFSLIAGMIYQVIRKYASTITLLWMATAIVSLTMASYYRDYIRHAMQYNHWKVSDPYNDLSALLEEHTEPGSIIGMTGGGNVGYFIHDRTIINMDGLINSQEYFQYLKSRSAGDYLAEIGVNYIFANPGILSQLPYNRQFDSRLEQSDIWYGGKNLMRYRTDQP